MSEVFNLLDQEGSQKFASSDFNSAAFQVSHPQDNGSKSVSFSATGGSSSAYQRCDRPVCTLCGRVGHIADRCYKKHGYPASFKSKFKGDQNSTPVLAAVTATDSTESAAELTGDSLSPDQIQQLVAFLSSKLQPPSVTPTPEVHSVSVSSKPSSSTAVCPISGTFFPSILCSFTGIDRRYVCSINDASLSLNAWVIDSGATNHVSHDKSSFSNFCFLPNTTVTLPNGVL